MESEYEKMAPDEEAWKKAAMMKEQSRVLRVELQHELVKQFAYLLEAVIQYRLSFLYIAEEGLTITLTIKDNNVYFESKYKFDQITCNQTSYLRQALRKNCFRYIIKDMCADLANVVTNEELRKILVDFSPK